jgi:hypothetical protein
VTDRDDQLVTALFTDLRRQVAPHVRPAGAAAAAVTVRRRRRNRTLAAAALVVALVVGPAIGLAWARHRPDAVPDIGTSPTAAASAPPTRQSGAPPAPSGSSGSVDPGTLPDLRDSLLSLPVWPGGVDGPCPSGRVRFSDGTATRDGQFLPVTLTGDPVPLDVDGDGRSEAAVRVTCSTQQQDVTQLIAFARAPDGSVTTVGRVLATHVDGSDVLRNWNVEPQGPLAVRVDVADDDGPDARRQWRTYAWDGQKFVQTGGPTSFSGDVNTTDLAATAPYPMGMVSTDLVTWAGDLVVTVTNKGPNPAVRLEATLTFGVEVTLGGLDAGACEASPDRRSKTYTCRFSHLAVGVSRDLRWDVTAYASPRGTTTTVTVGHAGNAGASYRDLQPADNSVTVTSP